MKRIHTEHSACRLLLLVLLIGGAWSSPAAGRNQVDYATMTLEELMNIEITSASKREESLRETAAAVTVLTSDDMKRMGAPTIADSLRYLPGVHVARQDAHQWAVSIRGFNDIFANKMLVVMDGRNIYTPLFSGVFWNTADTFLDDLERVEVVRGPGATVWGANAVNGVINIISKNAKDTQGWLVTGTAGTEERGVLGARYGGEISENTHFRVYGKYFIRDDSVLAGGSDASDDWQQGRTGFRIDSKAAPGRHFSLQGEMFSNREAQQYQLPVVMPPYANTVRDYQDTYGAHVIGRWTEQTSEESDISLQAYYDVTHGTYVILEETRHTLDLEFKHHFSMNSWNEIVWGAGYRLTTDEIENTTQLSVSPESRTDELFSAFLQDEITLVPGHVKLALGSKVEHNEFTGIEVQPSIRGEWMPTEDLTIWASVSKAIRTPTRIEEGAVITMPTLPPNSLFPGSPLTVPEIRGSGSYDSEELLAYELGLRTRPTPSVSLDLALFYHDYENLRTSVNGNPSMAMGPPAPYTVMPQIITNDAEGESYGAELAALWQVDDWWRLTASYTLLKVRTKETLPAAAQEYVDEGSTAPRHQASIWSRMDLPRRAALDLGVRFVDEIEGKGVEDYTVIDANLNWQASDSVEISLVGRNLLEKQHAEWAPSYIQSQPTEVQHSVYGKITWRFD